MEQSAPDMNAAIWQSPEIVRNWAAEAERQEPKRAAQRRLMALLLPFGPRDSFTFLDLGAGRAPRRARSSPTTPARRRYSPTSRRR
jgi:hypothetical protein